MTELWREPMAPLDPGAQRRDCAGEGFVLFVAFIVPILLAAMVVYL